MIMTGRTALYFLLSIYFAGIGYEFVDGDTMGLLESHPGNIRNHADNSLQSQRVRRREEARIVGGTAARNGRYPYAQISLATDSGLHQCGGSLVAPDVVLTAGHCREFFTQIRVNIYNLKELQSEQVFVADRVYFHPQFDALYFRNDFLFLKLNGTVEGVKPVTLNFDNNLPVIGEPLTVVGWGLTNPLDNSAYPNILQQVDVSYISNDDCDHTTSKGQSLYSGFIFDDMICAWSPGQDACAGDSGGPLLMSGSTPNQDIQVGVSSWGNGCATAYPGVYSRVSVEADWMKATVCSISMSPPEYFGCPTTDNSPAAAPTSDSERQGLIPIKIEIQLDLKSQETSWSLLTNDGAVVASVEPGFYTMPYELTDRLLYLQASTEYVFVIKDESGDGICCDFGGGYFQITVVMTDGSVKVLEKGFGTFALSATRSFTTPADNLFLSLGGDSGQQQSQTEQQQQQSSGSEVPDNSGAANYNTPGGDVVGAQDLLPKGQYSGSALLMDSGTCIATTVGMLIFLLQ